MDLFFLTLSLVFSWISTAKSHEAQLCVDLCPPCFPERIAQECGPEPNCPNKVKVPGCSCCRTCALKEGDRCGITLPACENGLQCLGRNGKGRLSALLGNRGICSHQINHQTSARTTHNSERQSNPRRRRTRRHPHYGLLAPLNYDGPCSRHYEYILTSCVVLPEVVWLPSCNSRGNYRAHQCTTSTGGRRGKCWCVDKTGNARPNTPFREGHVRCST